MKVTNSDLLLIGNAILKDINLLLYLRRRILSWCPIHNEKVILDRGEVWPDHWEELNAIQRCIDDYDYQGIDWRI